MINTASVQCDGCRTVVMVQYTPNEDDFTESINLQLGVQHGWTFLSTGPEHFCPVCMFRDPGAARELRVDLADIITKHQLTLDGHTCTCRADLKFGGMLPKHQGDIAAQFLISKGWIE